MVDAGRHRLPFLATCSDLACYVIYWLFAHVQIQDGMWNEWVNAGRIRAVKGSLAEVLPGGVRLADGTAIDWWVWCMCISSGACVS